MVFKSPVSYIWLLVIVKFTGLKQGIGDSFLEMSKMFNTGDKKLSKKTSEVYSIIASEWPVNPCFVAKKLGEHVSEKTRKRISSKYLYHFKKLYDQGHIMMKTVGNTKIAWPMQAEKYKVIGELRG